MPEKKSLEQSLEREGFKLTSQAPVNLKTRGYSNCIFPNGLTTCRFNSVGEQLSEALQRQVSELRFIHASEIDKRYSKSQDAYFIFVKE